MSFLQGSKDHKTHHKDGKSRSHDQDRQSKARAKREKWDAAKYFKDVQGPITSSVDVHQPRGVAPSQTSSTQKGRGLSDEHDESHVRLAQGPQDSGKSKIPRKLPAGTPDQSASVHSGQPLTWSTSTGVRGRVPAAGSASLAHDKESSRPHDEPLNSIGRVQDAKCVEHGANNRRSSHRRKPNERLSISSTDRQDWHPLATCLDDVNEKTQTCRRAFAMDTIDKGQKVCDEDVSEECSRANQKERLSPLSRALIACEAVASHRSTAKRSGQREEQRSHRADRNVHACHLDATTPLGEEYVPSTPDMDAGWKGLGHAIPSSLSFVTRDRDDRSYLNERIAQNGNCNEYYWNEPTFWSEPRQDSARWHPIERRYATGHDESAMAQQVDNTWPMHLGDDYDRVMGQALEGNLVADPDALVGLEGDFGHRERARDQEDYDYGVPHLFEFDTSLRWENDAYEDYEDGEREVNRTGINELEAREQTSTVPADFWKPHRLY